MKKKLIRITENDLHRIIKNSVNRVINEMSTPKQIELMKKLKGGDYDPSFDNLPVPEASKLIDGELSKRRGGNGGQKYEMVDNGFSGNETKITEFNSFYEAKKALNDFIDELDEIGYFRSADIGLRKVSDVCWEAISRRSGRRYASVYIRKKRQ